MNYLVLDVETTTKEKGNPFHRDNTLCLVGLRDKSGDTIYDIEYTAEPYADKLAEIKYRIETADLLIGFNIKFDLHWIRRYVPNIKFPRIWDCQLGEFILSRQTKPYPSLDGSCDSRNLSRKLSHIASQYWDNGIDTPDIPQEELYEYLQGDLLSTEELYVAQIPLLKDSKLFKLQCMDLLVLEEMEHNGMKYDVAASNLEEALVDEEITDIDQQLHSLIAIPDINLNSSDHISAVIYGGSISVPCIVNTQRTLKSGEVKHGTKKGFKAIQTPRLVAPLEGTETMPTKGWDAFKLSVVNSQRIAEGKLPYDRVYSISKDILCALKAKGKAKAIIDLLLRRSEVEKLLTTYLRGIPEGMSKLGQTEFVHGQFNQVVARTCRLSSSGPNLQNIFARVKKYFITRYT